MTDKPKQTKQRLSSTAPQRANRSPTRRTILWALAGVAGGGLAIVGGVWLASPSARTAETSRKVTLYKDPQCGCCESYAAYLGDHGFEVNVVPTHDLPGLNEKYGIPIGLEPCHISLVSGYVVGGHVPVSVVERLLAEKPKIEGITLPGMPQGSPGMNGVKSGPFTIYVIGAGARRVYAVV